MADIEPAPSPLWDGRSDYADWLADNCPCFLCRSTTPDTNGPRVLQAVTPKPDESLIGLVARTSARNYLGRIRSMLAEAGPTWHAHFNLAAREDLNFAQLAFAARLPLHEIEGRRYRTVEWNGKRRFVNFHGAAIPISNLELSSRRVTPSWLKAGYHSALGHHALVTHCPETGEILIDRCPRCEIRLTWTKSATGSCSPCGLDLAAHVGARVSHRALKATRLMLDVIHPDPQRHSSAVVGLHAELAQLNRGDIFELGFRLGCVLSGYRVHAHESTAANLPVPIRIAIMEAGSTALANWPGSLRTAVSLEVDTDKSYANLTDLRSLYRSRQLSPTVKDLMRMAVPELGASTADVIKSRLKLGVNSGELAEVLKVSQKKLERLRDTPHLSAVHSTGQLNTHRIYEGDGMHQLGVLLNDAIAVGSICEKMDISWHGVEQLACLGVVRVFDDGPVNAVFHHRQARRSDFDRLLENLAYAATAIDDEFLMPIHRAMAAIGGREKPWGPAILAMISGDLPFTFRGEKRKTLLRLRIDARDLLKLTCLQFDKSNFPKFWFAETINGRDTEEVLNIFPQTTRIAWKDSPLPKLVNGAHERSFILALAATHISAPEILARWNGRDRKMPVPFRAPSKLIKLNALGWDRYEVENAMSAFAADGPRLRRNSEGSWPPATAEHPAPICSHYRRLNGGTGGRRKQPNARNIR